MFSEFDSQLYFRDCARGIIIEDYFQHDMELRTVTIFGTVMIAANDCGLKIDRSGCIIDNSPDNINDDTTYNNMWITYVNSVMHQK